MSTPTPAAVKVRVFGLIDWSLAASVGRSRALDSTGTEEPLRRPWQQRHEGGLPTALVKNQAGCSTLQAGIRALSIPAQYEMTRHGHRRLS